MTTERVDHGGEDFDDDDRRAGVNAPVCYCGDTIRRVVKFGMCQRCLDDTLDARADDRSAA